MQSNRYRTAATSLPKPGTDQPAQQETPADDREEIRQTLYMPNGVYEQLRSLAYTERAKMQKLIREGINMLFRARGLPSWDEAKAKGELEAKRAKVKP